MIRLFVARPRLHKLRKLTLGPRPRGHPFFCLSRNERSRYCLFVTCFRTASVDPERNTGEVGRLATVRAGTIGFTRA